MAHLEHEQSRSPNEPLGPVDATVKPRNRAAMVALALALLAWLAGAIAMWLIVASHAWTTGCLVDGSLRGGGTACLVVGAVLSVGAGATGLISLVKPRAHGAYLAIGVAAVLMSTLGLVFCLFLFSAEISPRAINPAYLHPC